MIFLLFYGKKRSFLLLVFWTLEYKIFVFQTSSLCAVTYKLHSWSFQRLNSCNFHRPWQLRTSNLLLPSKKWAKLVSAAFAHQVTVLLIPEPNAAIDCPCMFFFVFYLQLGVSSRLYQTLFRPNLKYLRAFYSIVYFCGTWEIFSWWNCPYQLQWVPKVTQREAWGRWLREQWRRSPVRPGNDSIIILAI